MGRDPEPGARRPVIGHVAVVGGGLAGITAALDCAAAGARVTLLEVRPRLGGAAYSFDRDGLCLDNGQHVFLRCCDHYLRLLDRLGVRELTAIRRLDVPVVTPGGRVARLRRAPLPAPLHLAVSLARYRHLPPRARLGVASAMMALRRLDVDDPRLDELEFGSWLASKRQTRATRDVLWDVIGRPTLNLPAEQASLAQAVQVFQTGLLSSSDAADIGWSLVPLGDLHDTPARRALAAARVDVRLGWRVERVRAAEHRGWIVEGAAGEVAADAVVAAVPHHRIQRLLPGGALHEPLDGLGRSPIVNLHVAYDRPVMSPPFAAAVGSPVQWVFDRTRSAGLRRGQLLAVSLSAAHEEMDMSQLALRRRFLPALTALFPEARSATVTAFVVTREHAATFRAAPGVARLRPGAETRLPGIVLAGAYTATGWPATMEGAVRSGHTAARVALAALHRLPARPTVPA